MERGWLQVRALCELTASLACCKTAEFSGKRKTHGLPCVLCSKSDSGMLLYHYITLAFHLCFTVVSPPNCLVLTNCY